MENRTIARPDSCTQTVASEPANQSDGTLRGGVGGRGAPGSEPSGACSTAVAVDHPMERAVRVVEGARWSGPMGQRVAGGKGVAQFGVQPASLEAGRGHDVLLELPVVLHHDHQIMRRGSRRCHPPRDTRDRKTGTRARPPGNTPGGAPGPRRVALPSPSATARSGSAPPTRELGPRIGGQQGLHRGYSARSNTAVGVRAARRAGMAATTFASTTAPAAIATTYAGGTLVTGTA